MITIPLKPVKIRDITLDPPLIISPMAAITTPATRYMAESFGASLSFTEMVSSAALFRGVNAAKDLIVDTQTDKPFAVQLFGADLHEIEFSANYIRNQGVHLLDINMGCPMKDIIRHGAGAALMKTPKLASEIVKAAIRGVEGSIPVTVKIRAGWDMDSINAVEFAQLMVDSGAEMVTVHGRTRSQIYRGKSDPFIIKDVVKALHVPVIANGDVKSWDDAENLLEITGAAGVMIGRGSFGYPWIFREISAGMKGQERPMAPTPLERLNAMKQHLAHLINDKRTEAQHLIELKKQVSWYSKSLKDSSKFRNTLFRLNTKEDIFSLVVELEKTTFIDS
jgi:tRNA-dihydrouridine synthase B